MRTFDTAPLKSVDIDIDISAMRTLATVPLEPVLKG